MIIKECYVSKNGISCFTDINTMHTIKNFNTDSNFISNVKSNLFFYITLRLSEFILKDLIENKNFLLNNDLIFQAISFN